MALSPGQDDGDRRAAARAEAAAWIARLHADTRDAADERAFRAWLDADPANARAFEHMTATWEAVGGLSHFELQEAGLGTAAPARHAPRLARRAVLAGLTGVTILGVSGLGLWNAAYAGVYETDIGEQRSVTLDDGTRLLLDTDTRLRVRLEDSARRLELMRGRVSVRVAPDAARPFVVEAAGRLLKAEAATFDVRRDAESVQVVALRGAVQLEEARAPQALAPGERLLAPASGQPTVDRPDLRRLTAWQNGQAIFDGQTLAEAAAEMNRYSNIRLVIADPRAARLRIAGVYRVGDNLAFAQSVSALLPVEAEKAGDAVRIAFMSVREENSPSRG